MSFLKRVPRERFRSTLTFQFLIIAVFLSPSAVSSSPSKNLTVEEVYPGLATGLLKLAKLSDLGKGEILRTQDVLIKESSLNEVLSKTEPAMQVQLAKHRFFLLEDHATNRILFQEAKKAGFKENEAEEEIIGKFLAQKTSQAQVTITEAELRQVYAQNKDALGGLPFEQVKDMLEAYLIDEKRQRAIGTYILGLGRQISIQVDAKWAEKQNLQAKDNPVDRASQFR